MKAKQNSKKSIPIKKKLSKERDDPSFVDEEPDHSEDHVIDSQPTPKRHSKTLLEALNTKKQKMDPISDKGHQWTTVEAGLLVNLANGCSPLNRSYHGTTSIFFHSL